MRSLLVILVAALLVLPTPTARADTPPDGLRIFALIGQSNMFGVAPIESVNPPADPRIWVIGPDLVWQPARDPLHQGVGDAVGPGLSFAWGVLRRSDQPIGLVACGTAGRIRDWQKTAPPVLNGPVSNYTRCLSMLQAARAHGAVAGLLTYQGEADTCCPNLPGFQEPAGGQWATYYQQLIADLRADLGLPELPAIHAQLATHDESFIGPDWDAVKASQAAVTLPHAAMIRTEDLLPLFDGLHLTTASERIVGEWFTAAWSGLAGLQAPADAGEVEIATRVGDGARNALVFEAIPQAYRDLRLSIIGRSTTNASYSVIRLTFEPVGTDGAYTDETMLGLGPGVYGAAGSGSSIALAAVPAMQATANLNGTVLAEIPGYSVPGITRAVIAQEYLPTHSQIRLSGGSWHSMAPVMQIRLTLDTGAWTTGSRAVLSGVGAAP